MLKALIAAACIAVIAIAGLLFWNANEARMARADAYQLRSAKAACSTALASVKPYRYETPESVALRKQVVDCRVRGMISDAEWNAKLDL